MEALPSLQTRQVLLSYCFMKNTLYQYLPDGISFVSSKAAGLRTVYFPLCGTDSHHIKSSITPFLSGDIKVDKDRYVTKPVSTQDLRQGLRDFFVYIEKEGVFSLTKESAPDSAFIEAGQLWHKLVRRHEKAGLKIEALNFVPVTGENVELMKVTVTNASKRELKFTPTAVVPLFGRALANKHDHEHVTSLLHRISQVEAGVLVDPTMKFNEEGHLENKDVYFVFGITKKGDLPAGTFPTFESFYGDAGTFDSPPAVTEHHQPRKFPPEDLDGKEAVGALRFKEETLGLGESREYYLMTGTAASQKEAEEIFRKFDTAQKFKAAFEDNKKFWEDKSSTLEFLTEDKEHYAWMRWVTLQPVLRRIFGCSFLPDHDYGKGGKGWRDLWQDLLSLILIEPQTVKDALINNFAGVRIDGSNATIIGSEPGEFFADRNAITRVWMDHGVWPFLTALLYIHQTGDVDLLFETTSYFHDPQLSRTFEKDDKWTPEKGNRLKTKSGKVYQGTVLEHLLVENLVQFFNVGEHNITRLESADWNDGLDMAFERGESAAFMAMYGSNLLELAGLLEHLAKMTGRKTVELAKEVLILLDTLPGKGEVDYESVKEKKDLLFGMYFPAVQPAVSGETVALEIGELAKDLKRKGAWIFSHIRKQEKITVKDNGRTFRWFNGYYDNNGERVEGLRDGCVRMTLTGQVFPVMSGLAGEEDLRDVHQSVTHFLKDKKLGGFRLNTDFKVRHYADLGRAFGFAYGTKENGAFFSHMTVMYAYALYKQGLVREGWEVLDSIYKMCMDTGKSRIFPGIPEYFDSNGRGMYHYLTGSASWLVLTKLTQVFGIRGHYGDLVIAPRLVKEEFDSEGKAVVHFEFAGKDIRLTYRNPQGREFDEYGIREILLNGEPVAFQAELPSQVRLKREVLAAAPFDLKLEVLLG